MCMTQPRTSLCFEICARASGWTDYKSCVALSKYIADSRETEQRHRARGRNGYPRAKRGSKHAAGPHPTPHTPQKSKRWWTAEIAENRKILGSIKRARKKGEASQQQVRKQRSNLRRMIRQSKTAMWCKFLSSATRDQVWQALRYTKPGGQQTTKALKSRSGEVAESWEEKAELIKEEAFPKPLKGVERKAQEEGGEMWKKITDEDIREALFNQSVQKAPGPDRLGFKAIQLLWDWDSQRIMNIMKVSFRLGIHPRVWKEAKGLVTPKPNKPDYGVTKAISKKHFRPGGMAPSEWTRSIRAFRDTPVAEYSAPGVNTTRRVAYRPPIAVSPFLRALSVSYFRQTLWRCGQL